jgi:putative MATE family efflux protein
MKLRAGDSIRDMLYYWFPEVVSTAVLVYIPPIFDSLVIASLRSTTTFGALGMASNFLHTLIKFSEAIMVASIAVVGRHNGAKEYKKCGHDLGDAFWTTTLIGSLVFLLLFFNAGPIYRLLGVPEKMVIIGVPFLRLRAFGVLLAFILNAFMGFMRGVKNTRIPMVINIIGTSVFLALDYVLILGKFGFPRLGLRGSAVATIFQFSIMIIVAVSYILLNVDYKKYFAKVFFRMFNSRGAFQILNLSWPIMIDKMSLSLAYVWMAKMIAPMGKYVIASFDVIKNLERMAFIPALGFAVIITFLVSNRLGAQDLEGARSNIYKSLLMAVGMVTCTLSYLCYNASYFISFFDPKGKFVTFAAPVFVAVSFLVVFDLLQVILAGALRGAGDVKTVMLIRFCTCFFFFVPMAYIFSLLPIESLAIRFGLIYASFYFNNALMGGLFLWRILGKRWQQKYIR